MLSWSVIDVFTHILMAWSVRRMAATRSAASLPFVMILLKSPTYPFFWFIFDCTLNVA